MKAEWELLGTTQDESRYYSTWRLRVPNGWLVRVMGNNDYGAVYTDMAYVPDLPHKWGEDEKETKEPKVD